MCHELVISFLTKIRTADQMRLAIKGQHGMHTVRGVAIWPMHREHSLQYKVFIIAQNNLTPSEHYRCYWIVALSGSIASVDNFNSDERQIRCLELLISYIGTCMIRPKTMKDITTKCPSWSRTQWSCVCAFHDAQCGNVSPVRCCKSDWCVNSSNFFYRRTCEGSSSDSE